MPLRVVLAFGVAAIIVFSAQPGIAQAETLTVSHTYILGDRDSKEDARLLCYTNAKRKLLDQAGVLIQSATNIDNFQLTKDQIQSYSAAVLNVTVIKEEFTFVNGVPSLAMTVQAAVNVAEIKKQLAEMLAQKRTTDTPAQKTFDVSSLVGTTKIQFQPIQANGEKEGCTLVYRAIAPDFAYRNGNLVILDGSIAYWRNQSRDRILLALKLITRDVSEDQGQQIEPPVFAYLQTPHGTTAESKYAQTNSDMPGSSLFVYEVDKSVIKVLRDILNEEPVTIGFNRKKNGLDILVPLDLSIAGSKISASGLVERLHSNDMLRQFTLCEEEVTGQVISRIESSANR